MACMNLSLWFKFCKSLSGFQFPLQSWLYSQAPAMTTASSPTTTQEVNVASEACRRKMFSVPFTSFKFGGKCRLWKKTCQSRFSLDMNHVTTFVTLCVNCPMTGKLLKNPVILNWWSGSGFLDLGSVNPVGARESVLGGPKNKVQLRNSAIFYPSIWAIIIQLNRTTTLVWHVPLFYGFLGPGKVAEHWPGYFKMENWISENSMLKRLRKNCSFFVFH